LLLPSIISADLDYFKVRGFSVRCKTRKRPYKAGRNDRGYVQAPEHSEISQEKTGFGMKKVAIYPLDQFM
jgi:hypothetical protein